MAVGSCCEHDSPRYVHIRARPCHASDSRRRTTMKTVCRGLRINQLLIGASSAPLRTVASPVPPRSCGRPSNESWRVVRAVSKHLKHGLPRVSTASAREIRGVKLGQQALFAFVDSLVNILLTCIPEPSRDTYDQAVARGKFRYDRFLKSVGGRIPAIHMQPWLSWLSGANRRTPTQA